MAKKPTLKKATAKKGGKRRFGVGGTLTAADMLDSALRGSDSFPLARAGSAGVRLPVGRSASLGEPSGGPLARQGARGLDSLDPGRSEKFMGDAKRVQNPRLGGPTAPRVKPSGFGRMAARGAANVAGLAADVLMPDFSKEAPDADKPRNYGPDEGLQMPVKKAPLQNEANVGPPRPLDRIVGNNATAPIKKKTPRKSSSSADTDALADLRASAAKMREATSEMADKTGRMKESVEKFSGSFKKGGKAAVKPKGYAKGGAVKSRGDGLAQRGRTKGRMI